jgi:hypothetical protein
VKVHFTQECIETLPMLPMAPRWRWVLPEVLCNLDLWILLTSCCESVDHMISRGFIGFLLAPGYVSIICITIANTNKPMISVSQVLKSYGFVEYFMAWFEKL